MMLFKILSYNTALKQAKKKGLLLYLKALQTIRKSLLFAVILFFALQTLSLGFIGALISGVWLLPIEEQSLKIWILFAVFILMILIACISFLIIFSERTWLKISRVEDLK